MEDSLEVPENSTWDILNLHGLAFLQDTGPPEQLALFRLFPVGTMWGEPGPCMSKAAGSP